MASRAARFTEVRREAALRAANKPFDENLISCSSHDTYFRGGSLQLEDYRLATVFLVLNINATNNGRTKGVMFPLHDGQVGRDCYC